ncbi:MAG: hypothetical protein ACJ789_07575 [Thermomicrobiales bacterium]
MASTAGQHASDAWAYEQYIRDNWDRLTPYQQEEARAYLNSKFQAPATHAQPAAKGWPVQVGYICAVMAVLILPIIFAPAAVGCGIYNVKKGRSNHGTAQIALGIACGILGMVIGALYFMNS